MLLYLHIQRFPKILSLFFLLFFFFVHSLPRNFPIEFYFENSVAHQIKKSQPMAGFLKTGMKKAGDGNRTHVSSLEGWCSTIELHPRYSYYYILFLHFVNTFFHFSFFAFCIFQWYTQCNNIVLENFYYKGEGIKQSKAL